MEERGPKHNQVLRENFGPGKEGEQAFLLISTGAFCALKFPDNKFCSEISDRTVGFDVGASYDMEPVCSDEHERLIRAQIAQDLEQTGRAASFDRNGFGRA